MTTTTSFQLRQERNRETSSDTPRGVELPRRLCLRFVEGRGDKRVQVWRLLMAVLTAVSLIALVGCGGGQPTQHTPPSSVPSTGSSPQASPGTTGTTGPQAVPVSGIILLSNTPSPPCRVQAFDPSSETVRDVATFNSACYTGPWQAGGVGAVPLFSSDFKRITVTLGSGVIGWIDTTGQFTQVSSPQAPDFGEMTQPRAMGFDSDNNFWYSVEYQSGAKRHLDINRLARGSTSNPEVIASRNNGNGTTDLNNITEPYRFPDGKWAFWDATMCGTVNLNFYGDLHTPSFRSDHDPQIFRVDNCRKEGRPITPLANMDIGKLVWKEDGSQVVFELKNKLYIVDGNGVGAPREITGPGVSAVLNSQTNFYSWI
jgi:hypothetical protein